MAERTDCCRILLAHQGKLGMLKAIYGTSEEEEPAQPATSPRPLTPELFSAMFG